MSKPVFYTFGGSVWAAVPELAIIELGYPEGAIEKKVLNLVEGKNLTPDFLKLNPHATLPTLIADGKVYASTIDVIHYLIAQAPVPPGKSSGTNLVTRIHEDNIDPNFALLLARDDNELKARGEAIGLAFLGNRQAMLEKYADTPEAAPFADFYKAKKEENGYLLAIYQGRATEETKAGFYDLGRLHWKNLTKFIVEELPAHLPESGFIGGEKPGEDDYHVGGWLARIVATIGGSDVQALAGDSALGQPVPAKVISYWSAWSSRESWKNVYAEGLH